MSEMNGSLAIYQIVSVFFYADGLSKTLCVLKYTSGLFGELGDYSQWNLPVFSGAFDAAPWIVHAETLNPFPSSGVAQLTLHVPSSTLSLSSLLTKSSSANWSLCSSERLMSERSRSRDVWEGVEETGFLPKRIPLWRNGRLWHSAAEY